MQKGVNALLQQLAPNKKSKKQFLKRRSDFLKTYKGNFIRREHLTLYGRFNGIVSFRLGVTAPKSIGSAVVRNKFKRWCKEFFRKLEFGENQKPMDFNVFIGNKRLKKEDFKNVEHKEFQNQLDSAIHALIKNLR